MKHKCFWKTCNWQVICLFLFYFLLKESIFLRNLVVFYIWRYFNFIQAPTIDSALVTLFCGWACKARKDGLCLSSSVSGCCPAQRITDIEENIVQSSCPASALSGRDSSLLAESDGTQQRSVEQNLLEVHNEDVSEVSESESMQKRCCSSRSCCVPALGVSGNNLGLGSLTTT